MRGRKPKGPFRDKRAAIGARVTAETRRLLDEAVAANYRSLAQEIEIRLERSFDHDDALGGPRSADIFRWLALQLKMFGPENWTEDYASFNHAINADIPRWLRDVAKTVRPKPSADWLKTLETNKELLDRLLRSEQLTADDSLYFDNIFSGSRFLDQCEPEIRETLAQKVAEVENKLKAAGLRP